MKEDIKNFFIDELQDIFNAEQQIIEALPEVVKLAESPDLKEAFRMHLQETRSQVQRLEKIFNQLGVSSGGKVCSTVKDMILECQNVAQKFPQSPLRDAILIAKAQKIELYEVSCYGTLKTFAKDLDLDDIASLLDDTLEEEKKADKKLTKIAQGGLLTEGINQKAMA